MKNMLNLRILKRPVGRPGGWLWVLVLLALPRCAGLIGVEDWSPASASTTAVFCDIPKPPPPDGPQCASLDEVAFSAIRLAAAAVALNTGQLGSNIALDDSPAALAACASPPFGGAQRVEFVGSFPQGLPGCADPSTLVDANAFCVTLCNAESPDPVFCSANAHASTNVPLTGFPGGCTSQGAYISGFDPRVNPEPVVWDWDPANPNGVTPNGNDLQRTAATSPPLENPPFDAGAASKQRIERGDAYVEFSATAIGNAVLSHVAGLSEIPKNCPDPCTDVNQSPNDITFGISLNVDGRVYVIEKGVLVTGPDLNGSFGLYNEQNQHERFRVSLRQSSDAATATVTYSRLTADCIPGNPCSEDVFWTSESLANYPLRVDTSFREANAILEKVVVVRIQNP
ncbi:MAG: hypothetical protein DMF91_18090 [Acidobacteria bacterium]|nr:MAG: hypothetical protein DMF91_18090 [Acidobacteriota bacterium]